MNTQLIKYDAACKALAAARSVDEVKDLRDKAAALKAYARQAQNKQLEIDAAEIRVRAERRLGELLKEQPKNPGSKTKGGSTGKNSGGSIEEPPEIPTIAELGIDKKLSSQAQKLADIPQDVFEETMAEHRAEQQAVTVRTMTKLDQQAETASNENSNWKSTPPKSASAPNAG